MSTLAVKARPDVRKAVKNQLDRVCYYCGITYAQFRKLLRNESPRASSFHLDHKIPRNHGGVDHPDNLVMACPFCNRAKHDVSAYNYAAWLDWVTANRRNF